MKIRIKFIVFANTNESGRAASEAQVIAQFAQLNADFAAYNIQFVLPQDGQLQNTINSTTYRNFCAGLDRDSCLGTSDECRPLSLERPMKEYAWGQLGGDLSGQLNIYVVNMDQMNPDVTDGIGYFPWCSEPRGVRGGVVVNGTCLGGQQCSGTCGIAGTFACRALLHEIGHNLGLSHTSRGSYSESGCQCSDPVPSAPCANDLQASDYSGDFCCDTPPTSGDSGCVSPQGDPDPCTNNIYGPTDKYNYMALGPDGCWSHFTRQQTARLQCWTCDATYGLPGWIDAPSGACCVGSTCITTLEPCCVNQGGTFAGAGTTCENCTGSSLADACEFPVGACCTGTACSVRAQTCCTNAGGSFKGADTDCRDCNLNGTPDYCEVPSLPIRACCLDEGYLCELRTQACCELDEGTFYEFDTYCGQCAWTAPQPTEPEP